MVPATAATPDLATSDVAGAGFEDIFEEAKQALQTEMDESIVAAMKDYRELLNRTMEAENACFGRTQYTRTDIRMVLAQCVDTARERVQQALARAAAGQHDTSDDKLTYMLRLEGTLHLACQEGELGEVRRLVEERNVNPAAPTHNGRTPLCLAVEGNHLDVARYILTREGVSPDGGGVGNARRTGGTTAKRRPCRSVRTVFGEDDDDSDTTEESEGELVAEVAPIGTAALALPAHGPPPLFVAAMKGNVPMVQLLLRFGANRFAEVEKRTVLQLPELDIATYSVLLNTPGRDGLAGEAARISWEQQQQREAEHRRRAADRAKRQREVRRQRRRERRARQAEMAAAALAASAVATGKRGRRPGSKNKRSNKVRMKRCGQSVSLRVGLLPNMLASPVSTHHPCYSLFPFILLSASPPLCSGRDTCEGRLARLWRHWAAIPQPHGEKGCDAGHTGAASHAANWSAWGAR
jgi:hypothetical protein